MINSLILPEPPIKERCSIPMARIKLLMMYLHSPMVMHLRNGVIKHLTGANGSDQTFTDTDFPVFRLADAYLMYAEAVVRGGTGGSLGDALNVCQCYQDKSLWKCFRESCLNKRCYLDFILDERARELSWECQRRTDLIRFGQIHQINLSVALERWHCRR